MATANGIPAVFAVNKYVWAQIKNAGIMTEDNYAGLIPIIPIQESAPFIQAMDAQGGIGAQPYLIYSWYTNGIGPDSWFKQTDTLIYTIYSTDQAKLRKLVMLMTSVLKRFDLTADSVNRFISGSPDSERYANYNFKTISVLAANAGTPAGYENDPNAASITVRVTYTDDDNDAPLL